MEPESTTRPHYLDKNDVLRCLSGKWKELIDAMEKALISYSAGNVVQPVRSVIPISPHSGNLLTMPAYSPVDDILGAKLVTVYTENKSHNLPSVQGVILFYDVVTGSLKAIVDASIITNMRTAAASAVATKYLVKPDPKILTILGAGNQARSHYQVLKHLYNFEKIKVWNINENSARRLVAEMQASGSNAECHDTVQEAVKDADIIVTVTMSEKPILIKEWVKPGAHINAVGAPFPTWRELSDDLMLSSVVYTDSIEGALAESGDIIQSKADIYAEIGEVASGIKEAIPDKTTIFKSLGMAMEDIVATKLVLDAYETTLQQSTDLGDQS